MKEESKECQNAKVKFISGLGPLSSYKICSHSQPPWHTHIDDDDDDADADDDVVENKSNTGMQYEENY
ncbi:hypothetical protein T10_2912 [Trichinella papuae]|uniref:Uncharacterized protein n=1 Tax=Trichinella papuae TaxID=268474 RepID=A0A0V1MD95_9BILA|nr:hypothetical protein T10_2912 [Trichinella papuae]